MWKMMLEQWIQIRQIWDKPIFTYRICRRRGVAANSSNRFWTSLARLINFDHEKPENFLLNPDESGPFKRWRILNLQRRGLNATSGLARQSPGGSLSTWIIPATGFASTGYTMAGSTGCTCLVYPLCSMFNVMHLLDATKYLMFV